MYEAGAVVVSPHAAERLARAVGLLRTRPRDETVFVIAHGADAARQLARRGALEGEGYFGWRPITLNQLALMLATPLLARRGLSPVSALALEALSVDVVYRAHRNGTLGRFAALADRPGLSVAIARTLDEVRRARCPPDRIADPDVGALARDLDEQRTARGLADRTDVYMLAIEAYRTGQAPLDLRARCVIALDVPVHTAIERDLLLTLFESAEAFCLTVCEGDERTVEHCSALPSLAIEEPASPTPIQHLQRQLFAPLRTSAPNAADDCLVVFSAPGENRECVEIARVLRREASAGTPFEKMAVVLRAPETYRLHLQEALRRAAIPAYFAVGTRRPHPAGRAFLALLACAAERLSASRFAEYLSLGELPTLTDDGAPPAASDPWVAPEEPDALRLPSERIAPADDSVQRGPRLRTLREWERFLIDAAVVGGLDRWERRLEGLAAERRLERDTIQTDDERALAAIDRMLSEIDALRRFALPIVKDLAALPGEATWGVWLEALSSLAARTLRDPDRVLATLAELEPMSSVGPVALDAVRHVLHRRLGELADRTNEKRSGKVFVGGPDDVRGHVFDVVCVPGLGEKIFPKPVNEDPILPDAERERASHGLTTNAARSALERLALRLAVGAATHKLVASYPRVEVEQARQRTPSFYGLELVRAYRGSLPGIEEFARLAGAAVDARMGWPAPRDPDLAIDEAEHDLAVFRRLWALPPDQTRGAANYLVSSNPHLERALRSRYQRWQVHKWNSADGLFHADRVKQMLGAKHGLASRAFSPTAMQTYATCPYQFLLHTVYRLQPREEPAAIEELDALQRGSLMHEVQFRLLTQLQREGSLPVRDPNLAHAQSTLDAVMSQVASEFHDKLAPAIPRVWDDGIAQIRADLRGWLEAVATQDKDWTPTHFELSFGLARRKTQDSHSVADAVVLDSGLKVRGSIDLVERRDDGALRATDYKSGKARAAPGAVIAGGKVLQPVLYALVLEKIFPNAAVQSGRLFYCTQASEFTAVGIPLDAAARSAAELVATTLRGALDEATFLPAPDAGACKFCDYARVCGSDPAFRAQRKRDDSAGESHKRLTLLRSQP